MNLQTYHESSFGLLACEESVPCLYFKHTHKLEDKARHVQNVEQAIRQFSKDHKGKNGVLTDFTNISLNQPLEEIVALYESLFSQLVEKGIKYHATIISNHPDLQAIIKKIVKMAIQQGLISIYFGNTDKALIWLKTI